MAGNYAQLLDIINNPTQHGLPAWDNNAKQIEGETIQQYLLYLVNSLTVGYQFMGVATPSTSPGTPDQNVFYIGGAGTYNGFGSNPITIDDGCLGIIKWDGTWNNEILTFAKQPIIDIKYIGATKTTGLDVLEIGEYGYATNNPNEYFKKISETGWVVYECKTDMLFFVDRTILVYNGDENNPRLVLSPIYGNMVIDIVAFSSSRPTEITNGQFYVNTQSKRLVFFHSDSVFSTPLTTNGIYRLNGVLYWYNGSVITELTAKPKDIIIVKYINYTTPTGIADGEYYLNSSTGNIVQYHNGNNVIIMPTDGMIVFFKGIFMMYSAVNAKWLPQLSNDWKVPLASCTNVRWRNNGSGKLYPFISTSGSTDWVASIPHKVHKGDVIVAQGSGSDNNPLLIFTDSDFNIVNTLVYTVGSKAPYVCISEYDGYLFMNTDSSVAPYLYLSSCDKNVDIVGVFNANPQFFYEMPFSYGQVYYKNDTQRFLFNLTGGSTVNITELFNAVMGEINIRVNGNIYPFNHYGVDTQKISKFIFDIANEQPLSPADIGTLKSGINFAYTTFMDEIYAKFDALATTYPDIVSKIDAVTLANSFGNNMAYPTYCNLGGVAQGDYLATPTYRINVYKISCGSSQSINHDSWNKKTTVFIVGGNHPYELAAPANIYMFASNLLSNLLTNANYWNILANADIYILPCLNGYGIYHAQDGYMRINANGVNINRNFPTIRWSQGEPGQNYGGDTPGSEFETQLIMALTQGLNPHVCIDAHNFDKEQTQFWTIWGVNNYLCEQIGCNFFTSIARKLKTTYPAYFGSSFGFLTASGVTIGKGGAMTDWWNLNAKVEKPMTFEISRCINYENGVYNPTDLIDDYGNTLFSCNELALRTILMMLLQ